MIQTFHKGAEQRFVEQFTLWKVPADTMKLIAFDVFNIVIEDNAQIKIYSKKGGAPRELTEKISNRLGDIGFKKVSVEINDISEAWDFVEIETSKNFKTNT